MTHVLFFVLRMVYKFLETRDVYIDIDFQKLYDFVRDENYSDVTFEINLDVAKELEEYSYAYITNYFKFIPDLNLENYNNKVLDKITKDFKEWILKRLGS